MRVVELSGGVGGARLAAGLSRIAEIDLTVIVNVGDDESIHGLHVSPDLDTVIYTLAGVAGSAGWGRAGDTFNANTELQRFGIDNTFLLGDLDLALNIYRTERLASGVPLSVVTEHVAKSFDLTCRVLPASDDRIRTELRTRQGEWLSFQEYFVIRQTRDEVSEVVYAGREDADPAPGVVEAIVDADKVLIGPSNPPLSIWPILCLDEVKSAVATHPSVTAVSPLIGGRAVKGPADRVLRSLGLPDGTSGVLRSYDGLIDRLVVDKEDRSDIGTEDHVEVTAADTLIKEPERAEQLARELLAL